MRSIVVIAQSNKVKLISDTPFEYKIKANLDEYIIEGFEEVVFNLADADYFFIEGQIIARPK